MEFQNPDATLNSAYPVGKQIARPIKRFRKFSNDHCYEEVLNLNLLLDIQKMFGAILIFIAQDLRVVRFFSDDVAVMYLKQIMEVGAADDIYNPPFHPYTEALLSAVPIPDPDAEQATIRLSGNVLSALPPLKAAVFIHAVRGGMCCRTAARSVKQRLRSGARSMAIIIFCVISLSTSCLN